MSRAGEFPEYVATDSRPSKIGTTLRKTIVASVAAGVLGFSGVGVSYALDSGPFGPDAPQEKVDLATGAQTPVDAQAVIDETTLLSYREPAGDVGAAGLVSAVKAAVPTLLEADAAIGRMPSLPPVQRLANVTVTKSVTLLTGALSSVWEPTKLTAHVTEWLGAILQFAGDENYVSYTNNEFVVTDWQGVQIDDNAATVTLMGYNRYLMSTGEWQDDAPGQWQIQLSRGSATAPWRLASMGAISATDLPNPADVTSDHDGTTADDEGGPVPIDPTSTDFVNPNDPDQPTGGN